MMEYGAARGNGVQINEGITPKSAYGGSNPELVEKESITPKSAYGGSGNGVMIEKYVPSMITGTIKQESIKEAHEKIKALVATFIEEKQEVAEITQTLKENWVGEGRNEFEAQYKILISKIDDFSDALDEIYDALVEAEAEYATTDDSIRQDYAMSMQE